ncbi:MAG: 2-isopropylmalate synthase [Alphaproteobacteria bacterium]|nr:2-isopropylmalate synthase [Alphaproteobacteria bacterium]
MDIQQYRTPQLFRYTERSWPDRALSAAPIWCSVDLRDGNQALIEPMGKERKRRMFGLLRKIGFTQIEVGFPSASQTDFDFMRLLVDEGLVDEDLEVQVLTQVRPELIQRTFDSLAGYPKAILHLYNSTSPRQREWVFSRDRAAVKQLAVDGAKMVRDRAEKLDGTELRFQYSPESFTQTEMEYALEVCEAVLDVYEPTAQKKTILNLPATVEVAAANTYADQINWFCDHISRRDAIEISVHTHNDRGQGVAASEMAVMAGADRIEGTLFGNGERTGNVDLATLALNLYTHGIDPGLNFSDMPEIVRTVEYCNRLPVPERHPYAGKLVFTAFSGSHQDAIKKSLAKHRDSNQAVWDIPYLPINPEDLNSSYEAVIRINSQSGKGGVSFVLEADYGYHLPRAFQSALSRVVQRVTDRSETEISSAAILETFERCFMVQAPVHFVLHRAQPSMTGTPDPRRRITADLIYRDTPIEVQGEGTGPLEGFVQALQNHWHKSISISDFSEHAISAGSDAEAVSYIVLDIEGQTHLGVGRDRDTTVASLKAILAGLNRYLA